MTMTMRAVVISSPGGPEALEVREVEDLPAPGEGEVLVKVAAAGVNRADTVQRQGKYPPPPGASLYPGLECSGTILALGPNVPPRWAVGDQVRSPPPLPCVRVPVVIAAAALTLSFVHLMLLPCRCARCLPAEGMRRRWWCRPGSCSRCRRACR